MKILYHHRIRSKDGQFVHMAELIAALRELGHEVIVVGPKALESERFGADAGAIAWLKRALPKALYELLELGYSLLAYRRLARAVREHQPDCLYERYNLLLPAGVWAKREFGLPMLIEVNAPLFEERAKYDGISLKRLARWSECYAWRGADRALPVTQVLAHYVQEAGVHAERIVVVPNGINERHFSAAPDTATAKRNLNLSDQLVLGFTGFLRDWHGLDRVVEFLAASPQRDSLHLLIVGDGPARGSIEQRARELGVAERVTITGVVDRDRIPDYVSAFDVALQPAAVAYASPLKLIEYLVLGRAIVAPAQPNIQELLRDGENAVLFKPGDFDAFARALQRVCTDDALRQKISQAARATIVDQGLTWRNNAERIVALFEKLAAQAGRGPRGERMKPVSLVARDS